MVGISFNLECASAIGTAEELHTKYLQVLDVLTWWLDEEQNADTVVLLFLLEGVIARRRDGAWEDHDDLPSADELDAALPEGENDHGFPTTRSLFRSLLQELHASVEEAAVDLLDHLTSEQYLTELDHMPPREALAHLAELVGGLVLSDSGASYLTHTVTADVPDDGAGHWPAFHLSRLVDAEVPGGPDLGAGVAGARTLVQSISTIAEGVLPAAVAQAHLKEPVALGDTMLRFYKPLVEKFYTPEDLRGYDFDVPFDEVTTPERFSDMLTAAGRLERDRSTPRRRWGPVVGSHVLSFLDGMDLAMQVDGLIRSNDRRARIGALHALGSTAVGVAEAGRTLEKSLGRRVQPARGARLAKISGRLGAVGTGLSIYDGTMAFREKDYGVAAGHGLNVVGGFAMMTANPVGVGIGVALTLLGTGLTIALGDEPEHLVLRMFSRSVLGRDWPDGVSSDAEPDSPEHGWKRPDGGPDVARQISSFLSLLHPVEVTNARLLPFREGLQLELEPSMAYPGTHLEVRLLLGSTQLGAFLVPLDVDHDTVAGTPWLHDLELDPPAPGPQDRLDAIRCRLSVDGLPLPPLDWVEVAVPLPGAVAESLLEHWAGDGDVVAPAERGTRLCLRGVGEVTSL